MLTERQRDCLDFLRTFQQTHGRAPSFSQIAEGLGLSTKSGVCRLLDALQQRGFIRRTRHLQQSIVLLVADPLETASTDDLIAALRSRGVGAEAFA